MTIHTSESNLELFAMGGGPVPLTQGDNSKTLEPGVYMIVSSQSVGFQGDNNAFETVVATTNKNNGPTVPPLRATQTFTSLDTEALHDFLWVEEAKELHNP
jgi:hypothetical protein